MEKFLIGSVTGTIVLYTVKGTKKNKTFPVKFRITHNRNAIYIGAGFDMTQDEFNRLPKTKDKQLIKIKQLIIVAFERVKAYVKEISAVDEYSHDKLKIKLRRGRKIFISDAFNSKISELNKNGQTGTASSYTNAKRFIEKYANEVRFIDITDNWLNKFESWALNKEGVSATTIGFYLRCLRSLFNDAIKNSDIPKQAYPFKSSDKNGYIIPKGTGTKIALTIDQVNKITNLQFSESSSKERCLDIFLLSFYLGGINFKDLLLLRWRNITNGEVSFIREKTKHTSKERKPIIVPLTDAANTIIEKWGNPDKSPDAFIIPYLTDGLTPQRLQAKVKFYIKQVNTQLKSIGKQLGIDGLSTYVARHSFATILKNSGVPIAFIGETLGHSNTQTTENYLKSFESEQRRKNFDYLSKITNNA